MVKTSRKKYIQKSLLGCKAIKMPEGYYSGDQPNPNLRTFVKEHRKENPYNPETDSYDVPAFDQPIETTKATAIYNMHIYWSKKPHDAIRQYIKHYTRPGDLVLDPFCGSGGTALAALMEGRKAIAIDRSPVATFITKNYCTPVNVNELKIAFEKLKEKVKPEIDWLYETRCDRCGGRATTAYIVYSQVFQCPRCSNNVPLFDCVKADDVTQKGRPRKVKVCPHCHARGIVEEISTRGERFGTIPVLVSYICENGCKPARGKRRYNDPDTRKRYYFMNYDLAKIREIEGKEIPYWYPKDRMMHAPEDQECWGVKWRAGTSNFRTVDELFTKRNLWALAAIRRYIAKDNHMLLAFNAIILNSSKLYRNRSRGGGGTTGTYYIAQENREKSILPQLENKIKQYLKIPLNIKHQKLCISTQSAYSLRNIDTNSIDYIFSDPPYAEKIQYGELNFVWETWLGLDTHWHDEEIIVNEVRGKTLTDWTKMMKQAMSECYRVLKPGRWLSLCYHDTSEGTWASIQDIMAEVGFIIDKSDSVLFIDTGQKSYNQLTADKVNKRDLVINFRKPKPGEIVPHKVITGDEDDTTFAQKVHAIIREYLVSYPGATKDRIYDEVVSRMVRAGQMEAHNFDELLTQIADNVREPKMKNLFESEQPNLFSTHEISRWYLRETDLTAIDEAESAREDAVARSVAEFIADRLHHHPEQIGVHYSDIFEHYIHVVKDRPRRQLRDWLLDYFYKTAEGTYRLPVNEEEAEAKKHSRGVGTNRYIKYYISSLQDGHVDSNYEHPSNATLIDWIRHCRQFGLYEQGIFLFERGGLDLEPLPEEILVRVEEDYQVCKNMLDKKSADVQKGANKKKR